MRLTLAGGQSCQIPTSMKYFTRAVVVFAFLVVAFLEVAYGGSIIPTLGCDDRLIIAFDCSLIETEELCMRATEGEEFNCVWTGTECIVSEVDCIDALQDGANCGQNFASNCSELTTMDSCLNAFHGTPPYNPCLYYSAIGVCGPSAIPCNAMDDRCDDRLIIAPCSTITTEDDCMRAVEGEEYNCMWTGSECVVSGGNCTAALQDGANCGSNFASNCTELTTMEACLDAFHGIPPFHPCLYYPAIGYCGPSVLPCNDVDYKCDDRRIITFDCAQIEAEDECIQSTQGEELLCMWTGSSCVVSGGNCTASRQGGVNCGTNHTTGNCTELSTMESCLNSFHGTFPHYVCLYYRDLDQCGPSVLPCNAQPATLTDSCDDRLVASAQCEGVSSEDECLRAASGDDMWACEWTAEECRNSSLTCISEALDGVHCGFGASLYDCTEKTDMESCVASRHGEYYMHACMWSQFASACFKSILPCNEQSGTVYGDCDHRSIISGDCALESEMDCERALLVNTTLGCHWNGLSCDVGSTNCSDALDKENLFHRKCPWLQLSDCTDASDMETCVVSFVHGSERTWCFWDNDGENCKNSSLQCDP